MQINPPHYVNSTEEEGLLLAMSQHLLSMQIWNPEILHQHIIGQTKATHDTHGHGNKAME